MNLFCHRKEPSPNSKYKILCMFNSTNKSWSLPLHKPSRLQATKPSIPHWSASNQPTQQRLSYPLVYLIHINKILLNISKGNIGIDKVAFIDTPSVRRTRKAGHTPIPTAWVANPFPKGLDVSSQSVEITLESAPQSYTYIHSSESGEGQPQMSESNSQFSQNEPSENERLIAGYSLQHTWYQRSTHQQLLKSFLFLFKSFLFLFLIMEEIPT